MRGDASDLRGQAKRVATIKDHRDLKLHERLGVRVGEKIKALRELRGYSQGQLARLAETSQSAIARLEVGSVQTRLDTLSRIALALDADVEINLNMKSASDYRTRDLPKGTPVPGSRARRMKAIDEKPPARKLIGHFSANTDVDEIVDAIIASLPPDQRPVEDRPNRMQKRL